VDFFRDFANIMTAGESIANHNDDATARTLHNKRGEFLLRQKAEQQNRWNAPVQNSLRSLPRALLIPIVSLLLILTLMLMLILILKSGTPKLAAN